MSKPNLLAFSSSVGIYRNKRLRDLRVILVKSIPTKINFGELAPMLFQVVMAYAGENQIDGNFAGYTTDDWCEIFASNHIHLTPKEAQAIIKGFAQVGLFDHDKIRSWMKYNRHLADYENIVKAKRKAGKILQQKRALEASSSLRKAHESVENSNGKHDPEPEKNGSETQSTAEASKQLWMLNDALKDAKGKARKELLKQKEQLLSGELGVDLSPQAPAPQKRKPTRAEKGPSEEDLLTGAEYLVSTGQTHLLTRSQRELLARRKKEDGQNPVPE